MDFYANFLAYCQLSIKSLTFVKIKKIDKKKAPVHFDLNEPALFKLSNLLMNLF
jgi:hypothetical protein